MIPPLWLYRRLPFTYPHLLLLGNQNIPKTTKSRTNFSALYLPLTTPPIIPFHVFFNIIHIIIFLSPTWKMTQLLYISKHLKYVYFLLSNHKSHINQPTQSHVWQLTSIWKQVHCTGTSIHLLPPKRKPKIDLSLLNPPTTPSPPN